jgi:hypothetical protein
MSGFAMKTAGCFPPACGAMKWCGAVLFAGRFRSTERQDLPQLCRGRCSERATSSAPVEIQILDDAAGLLTGVAQACEDTIDELTPGAVEIQGFLRYTNASTWSVPDPFVSLGHNTPDDGAWLGGAGPNGSARACDHLRPASAVTGRLKSFHLWLSGAGAPPGVFLSADHCHHCRFN